MVLEVGLAVAVAAVLAGCATVDSGSLAALSVVGRHGIDAVTKLHLVVTTAIVATTTLTVSWHAFWSALHGYNNFLGSTVTAVVAVQAAGLVCI